YRRRMHVRVAIHTTFVASKKEPLAEMLKRVHQAFLDASLGEPALRFSFGDSPLAGNVSSVDRVLKRHPELGHFVISDSPIPGVPGARRISNVPALPAPFEAVPFTTLHSIAAGVPRSFPFNTVTFHLHSPEFGELIPATPASPTMITGVTLNDSWWVNG